MLGHPAEQVESYVRRSRCAYQHSKVGNPEAIKETACLHNISLLNDPNTGSPANVEASNLYKDNRREYTKRVRETVEKSWED